jgi:hypothetical protein
MNRAMTLPEVQWFVRGPKVAIFEVTERGAIPVDIDAAVPTRARPPSKARLRAGPATTPTDAEEVDPNDILVELPLDRAASPPIVASPEVRIEVSADAVLARAARLDEGCDVDDDTFVGSAPMSRGRWFTAIAIGAVAGLGLAALLTHYASRPIAQGPRPHVKAVAAAKTYVPSAAMLAQIVPTVSVESLPRAR